MTKATMGTGGGPAELSYSPPPSLRPLFTEPRFYNCLVGPIGSTKTTACIMFLLYRACAQRPSTRDGVCRTRFAISRNTLVQLKMTVLRDILHLLGPLCQWRPSENLVLFDFTLPGPAGGSVRIFSEWFLIPLDTLDDQRRLLSTNFSGVYLNEVREIDFDIVTAAAGRVGRWPRKADGDCTFPFVLMDTNPPALRSRLWEFLELSPPRHPVTGAELLLYLRQGSAMSDAADWLEFLRDDYYANLVSGQSEEWVRVHVHGEYGRDPSGQAVFQHCWSRARIAGRTLRQLVPGAALLIGIDPGLNPAAVLGQVDGDGGFRIYLEAYAVGMGTKAFLSGHIEPWLYAERFRGRPVIAYMDPAGNARNPNAAATALGIVSEVLETRLVGSNKIKLRIDAVERVMLEQTRHGAVRLLIDPVGCPVLVQALAGEYRYRRMADGQIDPEPLKSHPWSDVVDALGYMILGALLPHGARPRPRGNAGARPAPSALAWT